MHIDHQKLVELLTDASGIEVEKIEKQLGELVEEIHQALEDGEAYEIEGFGIFSGIGNRVLFIPSKELETEINFKYVGMEPIELEEGQVQKEEKEDEDPFEELQGDVTKTKRDPFAGLIEDFEDEESENENSSEKPDDEAPMIFGVEAKESLAEDAKEEEFQPGPEEWGIDAHKEGDKGANRLISSLMGEEYEEEAESETDDESPVNEEAVEDTVSFDDIFGETEESSDQELDTEKEEESVAGLDAELANLMSEESEVRSEDELAAGIVDNDFKDIFGDADDESEEADEDTIDELVEELEASEENRVEENAEELKDEQESAEEEPEVRSEDDFDDFDDPFLEFESDEESEEESTESYNEDIIPVITNISSDLEPIVKDEPKKEKEKKKKDKPKRTKTDPQPAPVWLWIVLVLVVLTGATVGLGYFSIINIPGITPQIATNNSPAVTTPPVQQTPQPTQQPEETPAQQVPNESDVQEQQTPTEVPVSTDITEIPDDQDKYGMSGAVNPEANDGYTIVLYSLSIESNAIAKRQELSEAGFRALVTPISSAQYGTLWRVSIGQFSTLTDAAIAAEGMPAEYKQSYFIKRITN